MLQLQVVIHDEENLDSKENAESEDVRPIAGGPGRKKQPKHEVTEVVVEGEALFVETQTAEPDEKPLRVRGDLIHAVRANQPDTQVTVTGRPAHVEGRGLVLDGGTKDQPGTVNIDRGANRAWINGPGRMRLYMNKDLQGNRLKEEQPLDITWRKKMDFDGRRVVYEGDVLAESQHEFLRTQTLDVTLDQRIDFAQQKRDQNPKVMLIVCRDGVYMESRSFDAKGLASIQQMQARDLSVNQDTGAILAGGPGWLKRVSRSDAKSDFELAGNPPGARAKAAAPPGDKKDKDDSLKFLSVTFQTNVTGNMHRKTMIFHDRVQTTHGPVQNWNQTLDPDKPELLPEGSAVINCDQLRVTRMPGADKKDWTELEAVGNTLVEGPGFTARAARMTYAQDKELLVMEGTGRSSAELWREQPPGYWAARKIRYWRGAERVEFDDARAVDVTQLPKPKNARRPPPGRSPLFNRPRRQ